MLVCVSKLRRCELALTSVYNGKNFHSWELFSWLRESQFGKRFPVSSLSATKQIILHDCFGVFPKLPRKLSHNVEWVTKLPFEDEGKGRTGKNSRINVPKVSS